MEKESIIVIGVITVTTVLIYLLCIKLNEFLDRFNRKTKSIVFRLEHAKNTEEYNLWHKKLRCHYLTLIPFVNENSAKKICTKMFKKEKSKTAGFFHVVAPSIAGRIRVIYDDLKHDDELYVNVGDALDGMDEVTAWKINRITGSVTINYDPQKVVPGSLVDEIIQGARLRV